MALNVLQKNLLPKANKHITKKAGATYINTIEIQYVWTIHNFSMCPTKIGYVLKSPTFSGGVQNDYNFQLIACPNGTSEEYKGFVSLQLLLAPGGKSEAEAKFRLSVLKSKVGNMLSTAYSEFRKCNKERPLFTQPKFIEKTRLFDSANGLLSDDILTIICDIIIVEDITNTPNENNSEESNATLCHRLHNDMSDLFESPKFCDVTLITCGQKIQAHKAILAARSPVFAAMFNHKMKEQQENQVNIVDVDYNVLREMLRYVYTGKIPNLDKMADGLLMAADKYELETVKDQCENALCKSIAVENAANLLLLGDLHSAGRLKNEALNFICTRSEDVMKTTSYQSLHRTHPHLIDETLKTLANKNAVSKASEVTAHNSSSNRGEKRKNQFPNLRTKR